MHGLTRYVLRQTLFSAIFISLSLTAAIWLTQSLRLVDLIVNRGLSVGAFVYLGLLTLPRFFDIVLPVAVFIAVLVTYFRLIAESEIVVMRAAGLSQVGLAKPGFLLSLLAAAVLLSLSIYFLPASNRAFKDLQFEIRSKFASAVLQEGTFSTISDNLMIYIRNRDRNGDLNGLLIQDERDPGKPLTIVASRGAFVDSDGSSRIFLVHGNRQQLDRSTGKLSLLTFEKYTLDLGDQRALGVRTREPQERYLNELFWPSDAETASDPGLRQSLLVEAHQRLTSPLTPIAFAAIALTALLHGEFNRRGQLRRILAAVVVGIAFEVADLGLRNLATRLPIAIPFMYLNCLLPVVIGCFMMFRPPQRSTPRAAPAAALPAE